MKLKTLLLSTMMLAGAGLYGHATDVTVKMNAVSKTMTFTPKGGGEPVDAGSPENNIYKFATDGGDYVLTAYATDGKTVNGTIEVNIDGDSIAQQITVLTLTSYATNAGWVVDKDYTIDAQVNSREGKAQVITMGNSITAGRKTFLALNGNSYFVNFVPSEERVKEGYTTFTKTGTLTGNINITGKIPLGGDFTVSIPKDAGFEMNYKRVHFTDFVHIEPKSVEEKGGNIEYTYYLAQGQTYNYRTWKEGGLTQAAQFIYSAKEEERPVIVFTDADYDAYDPSTINHSPQSNMGYETGDILVNANYRGHISMKTGETFKAHAMRMWELTDNQSNNYFFEPDFHYTIIGLDGKPCRDVIEVGTSEPNTSAWADLKATGKGTVIVLVTYDGIKVNSWSKTEMKPYLGGEFWGAIWPENTAAYVVSVDETPAAVVPNMQINQNYNKETLKNAGLNVDAEHDVFYYLDTEEGASYTFKPEGVASVSIAYPNIGERMATYSGFATDGVTKNEDGSYTLLLKEGRQIVKMTDASGNSAYQVLRARKCHREITNATRPGSQIFQPGDKVKIQYSGLYHPANKLAGIYNMSAYVTYNGVPNGSSLILGSGQYTFGSAASAQAVTVDIPADFNVEDEPFINMTEGVIQVNGYGDPIGNHREIDPVGGRSPNFTAIAHKTYFGALPDVRIPVTPAKEFEIKFNPNVEDINLIISFNGAEIKPGDNGLYSGTYGNYSVTASKNGYRCFRHEFNIPDDAEGLQIFDIELVEDAKSWDGVTMTEPALIDGVYNITSGAELAWFAAHVNEKAANATSKGVLANDIELGNYDWTPIGSTTAKAFSGTFDGQMHTVNGLYINKPNTQYVGLFGYFKGSASNVVKVGDLSVNGEVTGKNYVGGIVGSSTDYVEIDRCSNAVEVNGGNNVGGIAGYIVGANSKVTNCMNIADIKGTGNCGGIVGGHNATATTFKNLLNVGQLTGNYVGGCVGASFAKPGLSNAFTTEDYVVVTNQTTVTEVQLVSGEIAWLLGEAFGQTIGEDIYPVIDGADVYKVSYEIMTSGGESAVDLSDDEMSLYTNGELPKSLDGEEVHWFEDAEMTRPVSTVEADMHLYAKYGILTGIDGIDGDVDDSEVRWFNLQGVEVNAPTPGVHGIFIRVVNGKGAKVAL